ncbi:MAG: PAS domain-containing sensor histidine kinase, partial [Candidatus Thorarchaeota archaeon]
YAELSYYILTAVEKRNTKIALRNSESKLRESETRLAQAQRIAHSGSWVWNIEEDREIWSDEIYRIFGLAPQEFSATYEAFLESVHPDDRELVKTSVDAAIHKKEPYSIDHRIIRPDGSCRYVHEEGEVAYRDDGKPVQMMGTVQDITERVRIETQLRDKIQLLRDREELWKNAFELSPAAISIFNSEGLLVDANSACVKLLGAREREILLGLNLFKSLGIPDEVMDNIKKGEVSRFKYKWDFQKVKEVGILDTSRSDVVYMEAIVSSMKKPDGEMIGYIAYATDYTERQVAEEAMSANEEMFRTIFEESPICIELFDSDGILIGANKKCLEIFGINGREDIIGFDIFSDPNTPEYVKDEIRKGNTVAYESRFDFSKVLVHDLYETSKRGIMHMNCVLSPLKYGKDENLKGYIIHVQDDSDRHLAEQALMESRESYKELYKHALIGLFRARISDSMILECNDQFANSFGYENRQVLIDGSSFFKDFLQSTETWNRLKVSIKEHERMVTELVVTTKDGHRHWMRFSLRLWSEQGYIEGVMADITQEKYALEMLRKQKEELSEFAHSMNHDLKNIFHNMQGFIELVEDEKNLSHLKRVQSLIKETTELLDHSVILADAGLTVEENLVNVNLDHIVRVVAESTVPELIDYEQDKLPVVRADEMKVTQIFRNLFDNAVKHGQPSKIEVRLEERSGNYCIIVQNDGKEIPEVIRSKVFQKGFTTSRSGQGFGLTIVKRIVDAHDWTIQLSSTGKTTFEILIP